MTKRRRQNAKGAESKIAALRAASRLNLGPAVEIEQMLAEIEKGYLTDSSGWESSISSEGDGKAE